MSHNNLSCSVVNPTQVHAYSRHAQRHDETASQQTLQLQRCFNCFNLVVVDATTWGLCQTVIPMFASH